MPFPTATIGDVVAYVSNDGATLLPAVLMTVPDGNGNSSLWVFDTFRMFRIVVAPYDATRAAGGSWSWPTGSGAPTGATTSVTGGSYNLKATDQYVFMSADAVRRLTVPAGLAIGKSVTVVDTSLSVTPANSITFTVTGGTFIGPAAIIPGTSLSTTLLHVSANVWAVVAHV